ncbi:hypothetical protein OK016_04980 [Vibrio chagasii]|nr:hypothetical protein [Vibrio chagasii]
MKGRYDEVLQDNENLKLFLIENKVKFKMWWRSTYIMTAKKLRSISSHQISHRTNIYADISAIKMPFKGHCI